MDEDLLIEGMIPAGWPAPPSVSANGIQKAVVFCAGGRHDLDVASRNRAARASSESVKPRPRRSSARETSTLGRRRRRRLNRPPRPSR
jgi:hypothetical protein